jgi:hypothetical protein
VIGRLVCFRDPVLAAKAWQTKRRDWVIQTPDGGPYAGYGGFANFANEAVRRYEIAIAVNAAKLGVDDILYDYVRRPDGPISSMRFPGLRGDPANAIVRFLRESRQALAPYKTYLGASVFGIAATRPSEVAQPVRRMAAELDYVAPMVYPSHWARGEYGVADPNAEPRAIVQRSLVDFQRAVAGTVRPGSGARRDRRGAIRRDRRVPALGSGRDLHVGRAQRKRAAVPGQTLNDAITASGFSPGYFGVPLFVVNRTNMYV